MTERDIEILEDLSKSKNITKTAENLYTTQSAITKRLQGIEEDCGGTLFLRSKWGLTPTPLMEKILPDVLRISSSLESIRSLASEADGSIGGTLVVGISANYARYRLPELLEKYHMEFPSVRLQISVYRSMDLHKMLTGQELPMVVIRGEYAWNGGDDILSEEDFYIAWPKSYAFADIVKLPFINRSSDLEFAGGISKWQKENGIRVDNQMTVNDIETSIALIERGLGWSVLPSLCLRNFNGNIQKMVFQDDTSIIRRTHILYQENYAELPQVREFMRMAKELEESI
jgi:DNA-binding transcriptional LysR family regulator